MLREVRLDLDPALECPRALAPLIDPNVHSCGTVRPHGAAELEQPETGFFIAGMKSYGRAPTFLLATGYEQVRSIAAYLAGDIEASRRVELDLPETGVCSSNLSLFETDSCCAPAPAAACCAPARELVPETAAVVSLTVENEAPQARRHDGGRSGADPGVGIELLPDLCAGEADRHRHGWPLSWIVGGPSLGFLVSGLVSPKIGRLIEARGGRPVLAGSAILLSGGLLMLAAAPGIPVYFAAWVVLGVAMGAGLYDPAFSTLGRLYGETARGAITQVTLFGGFASTVCWPLSAYMTEHFGWRAACAAYAVIHLVVTLPLYWFGLPRGEAASAKNSAVSGSPVALRPDYWAVFLLLAAALTLASVIMTVISIHLLTILQARGLALAAAVGLGALVGPSQVGARVLETLFGRTRHPVWSFLVSTVLVAIGLGMLVGMPGVVGAGIVLYGAGSGIRSIAQGTVPLALFGRDGYAALMGRLAMPKLIAQAASPFLGAVLLDRFGTTATLGVLCVGCRDQYRVCGRARAVRFPAKATGAALTVARARQQR